MREPLPQMYDVSYLDVEGEVIGNQKFVVMYNADEAPQEREMSFRQFGAEIGAVDYDVHYMLPREVRSYYRDIRRELFWREVRNAIFKKVLRTDVEDVSRLIRVMSESAATSEVN